MPPLAPTPFWPVRFALLPRSAPALLARTLVLGTVLLALLVPPALAQARAGAPVVVAIDTSRSLDATALADTVDRLRQALGSVPDSTPAGLLAFDDEPRWIVPLGATPGEVSRRLADLELQGRFTLLNDALFFATRALPTGGVVLLVTDGRDESSAVVVDDIARRCEEQNVRILALGTGRSVEQRALRRLALLSDGAYLGRIDGMDGTDIGNAVRRALDQVAGARPGGAPDAARAGSRSSSGGASESAARSGGEGAGAAGRLAPRSDAQGGDAEGGDAEGGDVDGASAEGVGSGAGLADGRAGGPRPAAPNPQAARNDDGRLWKSPFVLGALAVALLLLAFLATRRRSEPSAALLEEEAADRELRDQEAADEAEAQMIRVELAQAEAANPRESPEVTVDTAVFQQMSLDERLERTRVLSNHSLLVMRKLGERPRSFMLEGSKAFAVGRDRQKNTLAVPDPALSSQHFKIVPRGEDYFFVDLESTNGSYVNGRPISAKRLRHGDVIRAGQVEFDFQTYSNV